MRDKWQGWALAGAVLMMISGMFRVMSGIIGLLRDEWTVQGFDAYYFIDVSALAWWHIAVGVLLVVAGWAIREGHRWGHWLGVVLLGVGIVSELLWLPVYPLWSILMVAFYVLVLYSLVVARPLSD